MSTRKSRHRAAPCKRDYTPGLHTTQSFVDRIDAGAAQGQLILKAIAQFADATTGSCWPSVKSVAKIAKCSAKTVRRWVKKFELAGVITIEPFFMTGEGENGRQSSNQITLVGYEEFATILREGGTLPSPKTASPRGQNDQGDELDKTSRAPGRHVSTSAGHTVSTLMNCQSIPHLNKEGETGCFLGEGTDGVLREPLPFTRALLAMSERIGIPPLPLVDKFINLPEKQRRRIRDPNAYFRRMVEDELAKQHKITLDQARTWFSMPDQVAALQSRILASTPPVKLKNGPKSIPRGSPQAAAQPKASGSLSSSPLVTGETP